MTQHDAGSYYYNFRTEQYELLATPPADWIDYIPQVAPAQALYGLYQQLGDTPIKAAHKVLRKCVGLSSEEAQP